MRVLATQIGISYSTLSRFENGGTPDGIDLAKLITWALTSETKNQNYAKKY